MDPKRKHKLPSLNEYLSFETNFNFILFSIAFLVVELLSQRQLIKYA